MKKFEIENHHPSYLPDGEWKLIWADEFDGMELDRTKWDYRLHMANKRHECFIEDAVSFDGNSHIIFHLVEKDGQYYSSALQTGENYTDKPNGESKTTTPKFKHSYGYYECRFKSQIEKPWWSAFWLQSPKVASGEGVDVSGAEVDIMEMFDPDTLYPHMIHFNGYGKDHVGVMAENYRNNMDDVYGKILLQKDVFHRYGCLWEEDGYTFYVDGVQIGEKVTSVHTSVENFVLLSTECKGYRGENAVEAGMGKKGFPPGLKDSFIVDYVRVFDRIK